MNKEWLQNYDAKENEHYQKVLKEIANGKSLSEISYPAMNRFTKLQEPFLVTSPNNIWSQIPLYGSSFIHVIPTSQDFMVKNGFWGSDRDIDNLIELSKSTGRVQFVLNTDPLHYEKYDYLEPIFKELEPPVLHNYSQIIVDKDQRNKFFHEFETIASIKFVHVIRKIYSDRDPDYIEKRVNDYAHDYVILKSLGYDEIAEMILNSMVDDIHVAFALFNIFGNLIAVPYSDPLLYSYKPTISVNKMLMEKDLNLIKNTNPQTSQTETKILTNDIGQFLMKKLTLIPESYNACISMMDKYKQEDLYKILTSIQDGCNRKNVDIIKSESEELSSTLDNIWKDSNKISKLCDGISYGATLTIGLIGGLATLPIGGIGGILAGLGFRILEEKMPNPLTEKIVKKFSPNYLVALHDFKEKYKIDEQN